MGIGRSVDRIQNYGNENILTKLNYKTTVQTMSIFRNIDKGTRKVIKDKTKFIVCYVITKTMFLDWLSLSLTNSTVPMPSG